MRRAKYGWMLRSVLISLLSLGLVACSQDKTNDDIIEESSVVTETTISIVLAQESIGEESVAEATVETTMNLETETELLSQTGTEAEKETSVSSNASEVEPEAASVVVAQELVSWNPEWQFAEFSSIHTDSAIMYYAENPNGYTICVNAGHGTEGGSSVKTLCHPDGTPKVTGGSTQQGAVKATAVAYGTTMSDDTPEYKATLKVALAVKEKLLASGYHVLMIREGDDVQLDNIARTVFANNMADCHVALHYDSTTNDKGAFYSSVPNVDSYRQMEPVASNWESHHRLGDAVIEGLRNNDVKIFSDGKLPIDLTQTSYSTVPSVVVEVGDRGSDRSVETMEKLANGIKEGIDTFFGL